MSYLLLKSDARRIPLADGSVNCCVTSPPYWGLRDYGTGEWSGGDPGCDHRETSETRQQKSIASSGLEGGKGGVHRSLVAREKCPRCGAVRIDRQLGLEPTPDAYVAGMVAVFREVRRVLKADGTLWLNIGDCYATGSGKVGECPGGGKQGDRWKAGNRAHRETYQGKHASRMTAMGPMTQPNRMPQEGLKAKDLVGIPWMVAFALRADGWYLRSEIVWHKPNSMPESVTDRPTKAHEQIFLLAKSERYYFDSESIRETTIGKTHHDLTGQGYEAPGQPKNRGNRKALHGPTYSRHRSSVSGGQDLRSSPDATRNIRSVWSIATRPFPGAHFATFPPEIPERCIKAGCPVDGVVFDPFNGSGTTGAVATGLGRRYVGLDINPDYLAMAARRISRPHARIKSDRPDAPLPLFS